MKISRIPVCFCLFLLLSSCKNKPQETSLALASEEERPIVNAILTQPESFYFIDFREYPQMDRSLPIGVFDSGTGGHVRFAQRSAGKQLW